MALFQVNFISQMLNRMVTMNVILPTDKTYFPGMAKRKEGTPYKTLYLLHGVHGNYTDWITGTRIARWAEERELAVVMPSGENAFYVDHPWDGDMYGKFIGEELVQFTRKTFPLSRKREDTYIGGLSMGGYGALANGLRYNDVFGYIVALSVANMVDRPFPEQINHPASYIDTEEFRHKCFGADKETILKSELNLKIRLENLCKKQELIPDIYLACGDQDIFFNDSKELDEFLTNHNVKHIFKIGDGSGHEWDFWDHQIKEALDWLPLEEKNAGRTSGNIGI